MRLSMPVRNTVLRSESGQPWTTSRRYLRNAISSLMAGVTARGVPTLRLKILPLNNLSQRSPIDIPKRYRPVVALQHDGIFGRLGNVISRAGWTVHFDVVLHGQAVKYHVNEPGVPDLLAGRIEARRAKPDVVGLPLAGPPGGVAARRRSADAFLVDPAVVDAAAIRRSHRLGGSPAIEDLAFIEAVHVDPRVGPFCQHELQVQLDVAELLIADQVGGAAAQPVQDAVARTRHGGEPGGAQQPVPDYAGSGEPVTLRGTERVPAGQIVSIKERFPALLDQIRRIAVRFAIVVLLPLLRQGGQRR